MKETITPTGSQTNQLGNCPERTSDQPVLMRTARWIWRHLFPSKADHPVTRQMAKSKTRFLLVHVVLCLVLVGPSLAAPFMGLQKAWATPAYQAHQASTATYLISQRPHGLGAIGDFFGRFFDILGELFKVLFAILDNDPIGWILCFLTAGTVPCPTVSNAPWAFDCPGVDKAYLEEQRRLREIDRTKYDKYTGGTPNLNSSSSSSSTPHPDTFYETALQGSDTRKDWLSGDVSWGADNKAEGSYPSGHLVYTYAKDTYDRPGVKKLSSLSLGLGIILIGPLFFLVGFQILLAGLRPGSEKAVANAMEGLGRVLLAAAIVGLSYFVVQMLFTLLNIANHAALLLHEGLPYAESQTSINGRQGEEAAAVSFSVPGDSPQSFRGVVVPMGLWGCIIDDFLGLMATRVANIVGSGIPIIGGVLGITGRITEIIELIKLIGEFGLLVLSVTLWGQAIARLFLINYYIVLAPLAFACWALPGHTAGNQVMHAWFKGFLQLLFMQTLQILILATMPSLLPDFGEMQFPAGGYDILQRLLVQLPPIIVAMGAVAAPKVMMGMGPMRTVAQAGALSGKAVAAAGLAISGMIKKR